MQMDVEIVINKAIKMPKIVIHASEITDEISELATKLSGNTFQKLIGYRANEVILLNLDDVFNIYAQEQKVFARTKSDALQIKFRLYEMESKLEGTTFLRISNSEIVNFNKVKSLDMSLAGNVSLNFIDGQKTFVSRRFVEKIKKYLGM